ncbi:methyl-accepting chemotaxis protein [Aestuariibacter sp. A3R04]|uniref:methyl-accepting chemotaxis protein n=1 Tax=Aestuariibacter sp. A3R04 TaxID=2841571 RepID=UPI001C08CC8A|nr:methyl-accepting chemotaxis protein [Aestuariibacter sp. A3R04]MBU3023794.1 methyl-accepting chemotaxis protein [Aestuariibacter sp. A3R04]
MLNFDNMTVRKKLAVPTSFVAVLILIVSFISISNGRFLSHNTKTLSSIFTQSLSAALNADRDLYQAHAAFLDLMLAAQLDQSKLSASLISDYEENVQQAKDRMEQVLRLTKDFPSVTAQSVSYKRDFQSWEAANSKVLALVKAGNITQAANDYHNVGMPLFETLRGNFDRVGEEVKQLADNMTQSNLRSSDQQTVYLVIAIVLAVLACLVTIVVGPRLITKRIHTLRDMLDSISKGEGDLTQRIKTTGKDEITDVARAFNALMDNLQRLISLIKEDAMSLTEAEKAMLASSKDVTSIASEQRDNLDQIATAVNQLSHALREVADNTQVALGDTQAANEDASNSQEAVASSVSTVTETSKAINHASTVIQKLEMETKQISSLLEVISGISEQTNLLALNAAIEAARAGEQGRGFAVVADEVRSLANRSQQATTDINEMLINLNKGVAEVVDAIETGSSQMADVVDISNTLNDRLNQVTSSVVSANDRIYQIAAATEEQSQVVDNLNQTVSALNSLSQQVMKTIETSGEASASVSSASQRIESNVNRFKV